MPTVADLMAETLTVAGVKRIYGVVGDSLNGFTDSLRKQKKIDWIHMRHEEAAAFAAGAEAHLTGELAVCAGSCGPGNLHLINGLFDCQRSRVPVLAIAAHIPSSEIGSSYFQATHPEQLFAECAHYVELVSNVDQMPRIFEKAIRIAIAERGVAVVVIPGDIALQSTDAKAAKWLAPAPPVVMPPEADIDALAKILNEGERITLMCGAGCAGAHAEIVKLAGMLNAPIVHSLRGKEHVEYDNPFDVGMTGLIGFSSGYAAMKACDTLLLLGCDFPYRQFYPEGATVAQVDIRAESLGNRCQLALGVVGDVLATVIALLPKLKKKTDSKFLDAARAHYAKAREDLDKLAEGKPGGKVIHPQYVARLLSELASDDADLHLRRRHPDGVGGALPENERQAPADRLVQPRLDGQCAAAGDRRPGDVPQAAGRVDVGRRRLLDDDGRLHQPLAARPAGEGGGAEQRHAGLRRDGDEGERLPRRGLRAQEPQLRRHGRGDGHQGRARRGAGRPRRRVARCAGA